MSVTTIIGPMFSGKSTELIRLIDRYNVADRKCLIIKHSIDVRFDIDKKVNHVTTHSQYIYHKCDIIQLPEIDTNMIDNIINKYTVVGIEEGFFFKNIAHICNQLANNGIDVIVSTIDSSHQQQPFDEIGKLIALSESVIKLSAVCMMCKNHNASFTIRTIVSDSEILVGGSDMYKCVCRKCLIKFRKQTDSNSDLLTN